MTNDEDKNIKENANQELKERLDGFSSVLEKFGMDLITKLGKTNFSIKVLTDKVEDLNKATIDIKALIPKLNKIIEKQDTLETEIDLLKSLVLKKTKSKSKESEEIIERDSSATDKKELILKMITEFQETVGEQEIPSNIIEELHGLKDKIFEYTGGHKILYEISQMIKHVKNKETVSPELKEILYQKAMYWANKL
ncbi:MAG: hypothetical protein EU543_05700 [Promethearchaeota archaeon]|nr:MAG: hypothetical protein EU543_05700 [Candidatus Lokiarchaeota archaeon]